MIAIFNRLPVKEGAAGQIVERFANSRGNVQGFPGIVSMEVLRPRERPKVRTRSWSSRAGGAGKPSTPGSGARSSVHRPH